MDVEPFLLSSAIKMVISQRLGKRICENCKQEVEIAPEKKEKIKNILKNIVDDETLNNMKFYK
jgi:type II secretory ATPase GspE/PulE/Tfp pilus assembly ATPase PilB-like protein